MKNSGTGRTILSFLTGLTPQRKPSRLPLLLWIKGMKLDEATVGETASHAADDLELILDIHALRNTLGK